ncbi:response regulator [Agrobacterium tumefaciens]|nr:response regulator [Agrobacterium tumefaciens]NTE22940.1 response regulator [Agrobacterium tumefaciens]
MRRVLIIEDDKIKIEKLLEFFVDCEVSVLVSYHSGLKEVIQNAASYDFLILDMTIPIWDKENSDLGGDTEQFGGQTIMMEMKRRKKTLPTIVVTMFDVFPTPTGTQTFDEINNLFSLKFPDFYLGAVFYSASDETWKVKLNHILTNLQSNG